VKSPSAMEAFRRELERIAPGTPLREGVDQILSAKTGALIVVGDADKLASVSDGGFVIDMPFTAQRLYELAKMDGAIILSSDMTSIRYANVHLVPDPDLLTSETGMRHRTAERVSAQTGALVISISQRKNVVSIYFDGRKEVLDDIEVLLARANAAVQTLQRYRIGLDELLGRLTQIEFDDCVALADVTEVIYRFEIMRRITSEVSLNISKLGSEGRLIRMQLEELTADIEDEFELVVRDYASDSSSRKVRGIAVELANKSLEELREPGTIAMTLQLPSDFQVGEDHIRTRGFRILCKIPHLPPSVINRVVERFRTLVDLLGASIADLDGVDGVGVKRATAILDGLAIIRSRSER